MDCIECGNELSSSATNYGMETCERCDRFWGRINKPRRRLDKLQANVWQIVKTFYEAKEQLGVYLSVDDIKVELAWGCAQVDNLDCVGIFPPGPMGLERLIERLNERV